MIIEPHFSSFLHSTASTELETNCCTQMSNPYVYIYVKKDEISSLLNAGPRTVGERDDRIALIPQHG